MKTALFLVAQLQRLDEAGIRVFIVRGNHDAESRITKELVLPEGVKVFVGRSETVELERPRGETPVVVHGISFAKAPGAAEPRFQVQGSSRGNIQHRAASYEPGRFHAARRLRAMQRRPNCPAPVSIIGALATYTRGRFTAGNPFIVMPGMSQGRDINEDGPKIDDDGHRWERWLG